MHVKQRIAVEHFSISFKLGKKNSARVQNLAEAIENAHILSQITSAGIEADEEIPLSMSALKIA